MMEAVTSILIGFRQVLCLVFTCERLTSPIWDWFEGATKECHSFGSEHPHFELPWWEGKVCLLSGKNQKSKRTPCMRVHLRRPRLVHNQSFLPDQARLTPTGGCVNHSNQHGLPRRPSRPAVPPHRRPHGGAGARGEGAGVGQPERRAGREVGAGVLFGCWG